MPESMCSSLHRLAVLLQDLYNIRNALVAGGSSGTALGRTEVDLERVHHLIARHREFCSHCKLNDAAMNSPSPRRVFRAEVVFIDRAS
jgi:hypothetical protein